MELDGKATIRKPAQQLAPQSKRNKERQQTQVFCGPNPTRKKRWPAAIRPKIFPHKILFREKFCFAENFVSRKILFRGKFGFAENFVSRKILFRGKFCFAKNFVSRKIFEKQLFAQKIFRVKSFRAKKSRARIRKS